MKTKFRSITFILLGITIPMTNWAQWSTDPLENTEVRDTVGMLIVPHIAATESGDSYISWYSATEGLRFDVYLQHFDIDGNKLWDERGLMVSNHQTDTWVTDYSLVVDHENCAILATQDLRDGYSDAFAYRISPDGVMKWGEDGIRLTNSTDFNPWPHVVVTDEDNYIFMYDIEPLDTTQISMIGIQKVNKEGIVQWGENLIYNDSMDYFLPQMLLSEDGNLIVSWLARSNAPDTVFAQENYMHVFVLKFGSDGQALWPEPVQVDTGNVMLIGSLWTLPNLANDGADGAYIMWQSFYLAEPTVLVNHINANGQLLWAENGLQVEVIAEQYSSEASMCFYPANNSLYVFFRDYYYDGFTLSDCWGVGGQKFSPDGTRLWGDSAKLVVPFLCSTDSTYFYVHIKDAGDDGVCLFYEQEYLGINGSDTMIRADLYASLLDADGNFLWAENKVPISTCASDKMEFTIGELSNDQWITAWQDNRQDPYQENYTGIYAQNISIDGNLGPLSIKDNHHAGSNVLRCYPNPCVDHTTVRFNLTGSSQMTMELYDIRGNQVATLIHQDLVAGLYEIDMNTHLLPPGTYICRLQVGDTIRSLRLIVGK